MLDNTRIVVYNNLIAVKEGGKTMKTDSYTKMVEDGRDIISVLNSVPEDKRFMLSMMADAFINGMIAQEQLAQDRQGSA